MPSKTHRPLRRPHQPDHLGGLDQRVRGLARTAPRSADRLDRVPEPARAPQAGGRCSAAGTGPYPSSVAGSVTAPKRDSTGTVTRTCALGDGVLSATPASSQSAATSARSWVRVRDSIRPLQGTGRFRGTGPSSHRYIRSHIGREPGHAVPVRHIFQPTVLHTLAVAGFDADGMVQLTPSARFGPEPARHQLPRRAATRGKGSFGVQEMSLQSSRRSGVQTGRFITHHSCVLP